MKRRKNSAPRKPRNPFPHLNEAVARDRLFDLFIAAIAGGMWPNWDDVRKRLGVEDASDEDLQKAFPEWFGTEPSTVTLTISVNADDRRKIVAHVDESCLSEDAKRVIVEAFAPKRSAP